MLDDVLGTAARARDSGSEAQQRTLQVRSRGQGREFEKIQPKAIDLKPWDGSTTSRDQGRVIAMAHAFDKVAIACQKITAVKKS